MRVNLSCELCVHTLHRAMCMVCPNTCTHTLLHANMQQPACNASAAEQTLKLVCRYLRFQLINQCCMRMPKFKLSSA